MAYLCLCSATIIESDNVMILLYSTFIAGGLATGADETKTAEERITYGGLANAILDPCYHQARLI